jgi:DNA-binding PadR family transcriptional regulator
VDAIRSATLSIGAVHVLHAIARGCGYGRSIVDETGLTNGTVYPALARLENLGLIRSTWEDLRLARASKRPARRYYDLTPSGVAALADAMRRHRGLAPVDLASWR